MIRNTSRRTFVKSAAVMSAGLAAGLPASKSVFAQDATPITGAGVGLPENAVVVASGLVNPRFIAVADDGTLYITENGIGGDEVIGQPEVGTAELEEGTPAALAVDATPVEAPPQPPSTRGFTGQITQVTPDGTQSVVASGLASYSDGAGPNGITIANGEVYFDIGGGIAIEAGIDPLAGENSVHRLDPAAGTTELIAYLGQYEIDNNPDGTDVNPNLYGMATAAGGQLLVADAGGNTIYTVDPATGTFQLLAVVPPLGQLPGAEAAPAEQAERQPVPTDVAVVDGSTLVGLLSEGWPEGAPSVLQLNPDGTFSAAGGALFFNVALGIGPDAQLYASELFGGFDESGMPAPGRVVRVYADGTVEPVVENVMTPHGINFDVAGNMYVVINSLMSGPGMPAGQVIRVEGAAAPA